MKLLQKSSDKKVLAVVIILAMLLAIGDFVYSRLSVTRNDAPQSSAPDASVSSVSALDPSTVTGAFALGELLQVCPTEKIINKMPTTIPSDNPPSVYFILDGERRELNEFDLPWVEENCNVGEQAVY